MLRFISAINDYTETHGGGAFVFMPTLLRLIRTLEIALKFANSHQTQPAELDRQPSLLIIKVTQNKHI